MTRRAFLATWGAGVALLCFGVGLFCASRIARNGAPEGAAIDSARPRLNILIVMVDTLRADHLGIYGYGRNTSPELDRFAERNLFFAQARSQAPCTFPSVNSLLSSRSPALFEGRPTGFLGIPSGISVLPEILRENGYRTAAVSASPIVRKTPSRFNKEGGFDRGFDHFDERCFKRPAACVNRRAFELIDAQPGLFFVYLHYLDPHGHYQPPSSHPREFAVDYTGKAFIAAGDPLPIANMIYRTGSKDLGLTSEDWNYLIALYDEEIRYFDSQFRLLLAGLEQRDLKDSTLIAVISDHGEEFLEHGDVKHCRNVFDTQVKTPFILHVPGEAPRRFDPAVMNLDLAPTLLDYAGIDTTGLSLEGESLRSLIEAGGVATKNQRVAFSRWKTFRSATDGRFKLIFNLRSKKGALYDLVSDEHESQDVSAKYPKELARLRMALSKRIRAVEPTALQSTDSSDRTSEQLEALGYIQ